MRYAVVSDIHGNLTALQAVFDHLKDRGPIDAVWCLGDIVGYGPDPNECVEFLRSYDLRCVVGNHDLASIGMLDPSDFNTEARWAAEWTMDQLTADNQQFLAALPLRIDADDCTLVHGSPRDPVWEYVLSPAQAMESLRDLETRLCFVGHTHLPALHVYFADDDYIPSALPVEKELGFAGFAAKLLVNPGSVGQPRDEDPRASYVLLDSGSSTLLHFRVPYDVEAVQSRMKKQGLPQILADRLAIGW